MVAIMSLWVPIVVSAVFVFVASSIIHMMLGYHRSDWKAVPAENDTMEALRKLNIPPGNYMFPHAGGPSAMRDPAFLEKRTKGPVAILTVLKSGAPNMGPYLVQWFIYSLVVSVFAAYVTGRAVGPGTPYLAVFRFAGCTAFVAYSLGTAQESIWYGRKWSTSLRYMFDGLIYGLLTAGTFGWLWPR